MKVNVTVIFALIACLIFFSNAMAELSVKPGKLGVLHMEIFPFSPAVVERSFEVGNTYNNSIDITLDISGNLTDIVKLSKNSFTLQPNEKQEIGYTVSVTKPGTYIGGVVVKVGSQYGASKLSYQADLVVFVRESSLLSNAYVIIVAAALMIVLIVVMIFYFKKKSQGRKK